MLPPDFTPSNYSVFCGRGKGYYNAVGNRRLRVIVGTYLQQYISAHDKPHEKSSIIEDVVGIVKNASPVGAFIKFENGRYFELSDKAARDKCAALFRDCLQREKQPAGRQKRRSSQDSKGSKGSKSSASREADAKPIEKPVAIRQRSESSIESISPADIASFFDVVDNNRLVSMFEASLMTPPT